VRFLDAHKICFITIGKNLALVATLAAVKKLQLLLQLTALDAA